MWSYIANFMLHVYFLIHRFLISSCCSFCICLSLFRVSNLKHYNRKTKYLSTIHAISNKKQEISNTKQEQTIICTLKYETRNTKYELAICNKMGIPYLSYGIPILLHLTSCVFCIACFVFRIACFVFHVSYCLFHVRYK